MRVGLGFPTFSNTLEGKLLSVTSKLITALNF